MDTNHGTSLFTFDAESPDKGRRPFRQARPHAPILPGPRTPISELLLCCAPCRSIGGPRWPTSLGLEAQGITHRPCGTGSREWLASTAPSGTSIRVPARATATWLLPFGRGGVDGSPEGRPPGRLGPKTATAAFTKIEQIHQDLCTPLLVCAVDHMSAIAIVGRIGNLPKAAAHEQLHGS